mmetsp:Transcript_10396/g.11876  ORF Transcript_10396/g.11876 Transcript_10396/m.11876 type:complete len:88 (-) Transcript_10396:388-651(-)
MAVEFTGPAAYFFGYMGATIALVFAILGAAYGTAKCGVGIMSMGVLHPDMVIKNIMPVRISPLENQRLNNEYKYIFCCFNRLLWLVC